MAYGGRSPSYIFPTIFISPEEYPTPGMLFPASSRSTTTRFINRRDAQQMLIYTHGSCLNNGQAKARAGCAYVFGPSEDGYIESSLASLDFPNNMPTNPRAELWAVILALRCYPIWVAEGFNKLVLASDSDWLVRGATEWAHVWVCRGWRKTRSKEKVKNRDLWEIFFAEVKRCHEAGLMVRMWKIPKGLNEAAYWAANGAAWTVHNDGRDQYMKSERTV
ncbi:hypothetical protein E4U49_003290 [Claviceps purpurea]|nr:hypothetical protein E4U49_003290 [Claviceps purpurea]